MTRVETVLQNMEANSVEFKRLCEVKACSEDLLRDVNVALFHGTRMSADIDTVMTHMLLLKNKLESKTDEE